MSGQSINPIALELSIGCQWAHHSAVTASHTTTTTTTTAKGNPSLSLTVTRMHTCTFFRWGLMMVLDGAGRTDSYYYYCYIFPIKVPKFSLNWCAAFIKACIYIRVNWLHPSHKFDFDKMVNFKRGTIPGVWILGYAVIFLKKETTQTGTGQTTLIT